MARSSHISHIHAEGVMKRIVPIVLFGLVLFSCAPPKQDVTQVRKTIEEMSQKAAKEMVAGTMDTTLASYTDDAVSLPNFSPMLKGKKAIREYSENMMKAGLKFTKVNFTTIDVQVSGNMAFEIGSYTMTLEVPPMGAMSDEGKYLTVYEQGKDGKWRIKAETWNTNKEPAMHGSGG
jgi:uncharacterized protein (TIGR02246 family)